MHFLKLARSLKVVHNTHMPNSVQNIQPPSFNDLSQPAQNSSANYDYGGAGNVYQESTDSMSSAYDLPLSIISATDGIWTPLFGVALGISALFLIVIIYSLFRVVQIRLAEKEHFAHQPRSPEVELLLGHKSEHGASTEGGSQTRQRWQQVERHIQSTNQNDWRLAILEADIMLDDLISSRGYVGEGLGEKLKQVRPEDLNSIEAAWEAHKIRNKIAHEGSAHELNEREVKRVIGLYKQVFTEAKFI